MSLTLKERKESGFMFNFISIIVGVAAWVFGCLAVASKTSRAAHGLSVASFTACVGALISQFLEIGRRAALYDYTAIEDTIRGVIIAAVVLTVITVVLNVLAFVRRK